MGVLAFLSISFLLVVPKNSLFISKLKQIQFEWVGAPSYVKPIFFRCYADRIEYYNLFENRDITIHLNELLMQLEGENPELFLYLVQLLKLNSNIKKQFEKTEYYPLLLIYQDGVLSSELIKILIEKIEGLNFGMEPMLPNFEIPYQGLGKKNEN